MPVEHGFAHGLEDAEAQAVPLAMLEDYDEQGPLVGILISSVSDRDDMLPDSDEVDVR